MTSALFSHLLACHGVSSSQNAVKSQRTATQPCGNTADESANNGERNDAGNRMKMSVTVNKRGSLDVSSCVLGEERESEKWLHWWWVQKSHVWTSLPLIITQCGLLSHKVHLYFIRYSVGIRQKTFASLVLSSTSHKVMYIALVITKSWPQIFRFCCGLLFFQGTLELRKGIRRWGVEPRPGWLIGAGWQGQYVEPVSPPDSLISSTIIAAIF